MGNRYKLHLCGQYRVRGHLVTEWAVMDMSNNALVYGPTEDLDAARDERERLEAGR